MQGDHGPFMQCKKPVPARISYARIQERLKSLGLSENEASSLASEGRDRNLINRIKKGTTESPRMITLQRLAGILNCSVNFLLEIDDEVGAQFERGVLPRTTKAIPLVGKVEAGRYHLVDEFAAEQDYSMIDGARHPRFLNASHTAHEVVGDSMNAVEGWPIFDGEIVIAVDWTETGYRPTTDMIVVVEQLRDGGHMREVTLKQIEVRHNGIALCPRSTNKSNREIWIPKDHDDDGRTVQIIGLVFSKHSFHKVPF